MAKQSKVTQPQPLPTQEAIWTAREHAKIFSMMLLALHGGLGEGSLDGDLVVGGICEVVGYAADQLAKPMTFAETYEIRHAMEAVVETLRFAQRPGFKTPSMSEPYSAAQIEIFESCAAMAKLTVEACHVTAEACRVTAEEARRVASR